MIFFFSLHMHLSFPTLNAFFSSPTCSQVLFFSVAFIPLGFPGDFGVHWRKGLAPLGGSSEQSPGRQETHQGSSSQASLLFQPPHRHAPCEISSTCPVHVPRWSPGHREKLPQSFARPLCSSIFPSSHLRSLRSFPSPLPSAESPLPATPIPTCPGEQRVAQEKGGRTKNAPSKAGRCQQQGVIAPCPEIAPGRCHSTLEGGHSALQKHQDVHPTRVSGSPAKPPPQWVGSQSSVSLYTGLILSRPRSD